MKLPDFINFDALNRVRNQMNAALIDNFSFDTSSTLSLVELEEMVTNGKDIDIGELKVLEDGTLAYKDSRVLLHIRDIAIYHANEDISKLPKFHISECKTLIDMREKNRFGRYVVSIRTDGKFNLNFIKNNKETHSIQKLDVCMNCLDNLSYKCEPSTSYIEKRKIRDDFLIEEYFEKYPRNIFSSRPRHTSADAPINSYPSNWNEISLNYKNFKNYICEGKKCGVNLSSNDYRKFMHVHHKNGLKHECHHSNLIALCIYCHAEEHMHGHLKVLPEYRSFLLLRDKLLATNNNSFSFTMENKLKQKDIFQKILDFAAANNLDVKDNRSKNGAFWIFYNSFDGGLAQRLQNLGFKYSEGKGWWKK